MGKRKNLKFLLSSLLMFAVPFGTTVGTTVVYENNNSSIVVNKDATKGSSTSTSSLEGCDGNHTGDWNALDNDNVVNTYNYILPSGNYYLKEDLTLSTYLTIEEGADVTLCLGGNDITASTTTAISLRAYTANSETVFTLHDCSEGYGGVISSTLQALYLILRSDSSIVVNITGGNIQGGENDSEYSRACGIIATSYENNGSTTINMSGGKISSESSIGSSFGVCFYTPYDNFPVNPNNTFELNISGGTIYGGTSGVYVINDLSNTSTIINMLGGTLSGNYAVNLENYGDNDYTELNVSGGTIVADCVSPSEATVTITGGYYDFNSTDFSNFGSNDTFTVIGGYFTDNAYNAISSYISPSSIVFDANDSEVLLDVDYDSFYPNAVYLNGGTESTSACVLGTICEGTDVENYVFTIEDSDGYSTLSYSYTDGIDVVSNGSLPTEVGEYTVTLGYTTHITNDGRTPKEYHYAGETSFELVIAEHTLSDYIKNDTWHYQVCTNTYCDGDVFNLEEHNYQETGTHTYKCVTCSNDKTTAHDYSSGEYEDNGDGTHSPVCDECGEKDTNQASKVYHDTDKEINAHTTVCACGEITTTEHNYTGAFYVYDETIGAHYQVCTICNESKEYSAHNYVQDPTDSSKYTCSSCGNIEYTSTSSSSTGSTGSTTTTTTSDGNETLVYTLAAALILLIVIAIFAIDFYRAQRAVDKDNAR